MAEAVAREAAALAEGRAMIRIERRAARHVALALAPGHPARMAYEALRGAAFPRSAGYAAQAAIAAHLEALRGVIEEARAAAPEAQVDEPIMAGLDGQDDALMHGAPCAQERRHTEDTTDPQTGPCSEPAGEERGASIEPERPTDRERSGREEDGKKTGRSRSTDGAARSPRRAGRRSGLPAAPCCARLTPAMLHELGSEELRLYVDHLEPRPPGQPPTLRDVERAALMRRREMEITPAAWEDVEAALGWLDALVALIVVDRNRRHPKTPVRNPGGLLRDLARRRRAGTLDLAASVMGVWRRADPRDLEECGATNRMRAARQTG